MKHCAKTPHEVLVNWVAKVTNDPVVQTAGPVNVIGVGNNEGRHTLLPRLDDL
jgi:hypothetical protein